MVFLLFVADNTCVNRTNEPPDFSGKLVFYEQFTHTLQTKSDLKYYKTERRLKHSMITFWHFVIFFVHYTKPQLYINLVSFFVVVLLETQPTHTRPILILVPEITGVLCPSVKKTNVSRNKKLLLQTHIYIRTESEIYKTQVNLPKRFP